MQLRTVAGLLVAVVLAGCAAVGVNATRPSVTALDSARELVPDSMSPSVAGSSLTETPGKKDDLDRLVRELEERRLDAVYRKDPVALRGLFANEGFYREQLRLFDAISFPRPPGFVGVHVVSTIVETPSCLAFRVDIDNRATLGPEARSEVIMVLERIESGWGFSYEGRGWACDGTHPLGD